MTDKIKLNKILEDISNGKQSPAEKFLLKKFGQSKGLEFIKFLSENEIKYDDFNVKFTKITNDDNELTLNIATTPSSNTERYLISLYSKKNELIGKLTFNIFPDDPRYIRMAFTEIHEKDDVKTLDLLLQMIDEIAMKIEAKVVDAPFPLKSEQAVYRQHKYEPFSAHATGSDRIYNKYNTNHCKTNMLGLADLFDKEIEN